MVSDEKSNQEVRSLRETRREKNGWPRLCRVRRRVVWVRQQLGGSWRFEGRSHRNGLWGNGPKAARLWEPYWSRARSFNVLALAVFFRDVLILTGTGSSSSFKSWTSIGPSPHDVFTTTMYSVKKVVQVVWIFLFLLTKPQAVKETISYGAEVVQMGST